MQSSSYSNILKWAKRDKIIPLCNNCHKKEEASIFHKFRDLILRPDLFNMSPEQIDQLLIVGKSMNSNEKTKIQKWVRKRYIIKKVFGGKCIGCGKVNIFNNLPTLTLHHRNPLIKSIEMTEIFTFNCETIFHIILKENAVCLCANCHSLLHSDLHSHLEDLFKDEYFTNNLSELRDFKKRYDQIFKMLLDNINNFKFKNIEMKSPLKLEFDIKNIWKIHFLEAFYFMQENQISNFRIKDFIKSFEYRHEYAYEFMNKLLEKGILKKIKEYYYVQVKYELTKKGKEMATELIEKHKKMAEKIQNQAEIQNKAVIDENERTLSFEDVIKKYPFLIFEIILQNGYNEFTNIQLSKLVKRQARTMNKNLKEKLIPEGIVEKVEMPLYIQIYQYNNVFRLTNKGYQLIKKYFKDKPTFVELNKINIEKIKNNLIRYSIFIYNLIQKKRYNEFLTKDIIDLSITKRKDKGRYIGYLIRNSLIPEGIIEELKEPPFIKKVIPATKIYKLTERGIKIAKRILEK